MLSLLIPLFLSPAVADEGAPAGGVHLRDLMVGMPACTARPQADPMLDLENACVDGLCPGADLQQFIAMYGEPDRCNLPDIGNTEICRFGDYVSVMLKPGSTTAGTIWVESGHPARDANGLGPGVSLACFVDQFGDHAIGVDVKVRDGQLSWEHIQFRKPRTIVSVDENGLVDKIQLSGRGHSVAR